MRLTLSQQHDAFDRAELLTDAIVRRTRLGHENPAATMRAVNAVHLIKARSRRYRILTRHGYWL